MKLKDLLDVLEPPQLNIILVDPNGMPIKFKNSITSSEGYTAIVRALGNDPVELVSILDEHTLYIKVGVGG